MSRLVLAMLMVAVGLSLLTFSVRTDSQQPPASKTTTAARIRITEGPALESATDDSAIIRWTTNIGGTSIEHSVVHYGTDPKNLSGRAESPNRRNPNLPSMIHRVYMTNLRPRTIYYYTVESLRGDNTSVGASSDTVNQFTTH